MEKTPVINQEVYVPSNRFRDWYREVPEELRRIEYEFWKSAQQKKHISKFQKQGTQVVDGYTSIPEYSLQQESKDWKSFEQSFFTGEERKEKLYEIIEACKKDEGLIFTRIVEELATHNIPENLREPHSLLIGGSVAIGPRDVHKDTETDIDLYVVLDNHVFDTQNKGWKRTVTEKSSIDGLQYQIFFLGEDSHHLPEFLFPVHIYARPHITLYSKYDKDQFDIIKRNVIKETVQDVPKLKIELDSMDEYLEKQRTAKVFEK